MSYTNDQFKLCEHSKWKYLAITWEIRVPVWSEEFSNHIAFSENMVNHQIALVFQTRKYYSLHLMMQSVTERVPSYVDSVWLFKIIVENATLRSRVWRLVNAYSKNRSMVLLIIPEVANSFCAASLPVLNKTAINSTIWKKNNRDTEFN